MRIAGCIAFVLLAAGACGSGSDDADLTEDPPTTTVVRDTQAVAVIANSLRETGESDPNALQFTPTEAECAAETIADEISRARLEEVGLDVEGRVGPELSEPPLTIAEGDAVYRAYGTCVDLPAQLTALLASDGGMTADVAQCVAGAYVESGIMREALLNPQFNQEVNDRIDAILADAEAECSR